MVNFFLPHLEAQGEFRYCCSWAKDNPPKKDMIHITQTTILSIKDMSIACRYTYFYSLMNTENMEEIVEEKKEVESIRF